MTEAKRELYVEEKVVVEVQKTTVTNENSHILDDRTLI